MIVLLSPAKTMDSSPPPPELLSSIPRGKREADNLAKQLSALSETQLKDLLKVSNNIARENHERLSHWGSQPQKQCVISYDGSAFRSLQASAFESKDFEFAQQHLRIISGMYGLLRPLDKIQPYRLEMAAKLKTASANNLVQFWKAKILQWLKEDLEALPEEERFVVNCASQEYAKAVDFKEIGVPVIDIHFPGHAMLSKPARGAVVHFVIKEKVQAVEKLKQFSGKSNEWQFDAQQSTDSKFVFVKPQNNRKRSRKDT